MSQWPALTICNQITRRSAFALALGALVLPRPGRGQTKPITLAIPDLAASFADSGDIAHLSAARISDDLRGTGQFALLDSSALTTASATGIVSSGLPRFEVWRAAGVAALVTGSIGPAGEKIKSEFHLWDIQIGQQLMGQQYIARAGDWRQIAHAMSGRIYEHLIGRKRDFGSDKN